MAASQMNEIMQHVRRTVLLRDESGPTDGQLLGCFIEHQDDAAFATLVRRHGPMVWGVCRRLLKLHDAEDAFQATFLVLVRKAAAIVSRERVANWLYGVAHQTALQARRNASRRRAREKLVTEMPEPAVAEQDLWNDLQPLLDQELSCLPDAYREVIVLCDLEGRTRKEAARQLGMPEGTIASRLARARRMLAKRLTQRGVALSGGALAAVLAQKVASAGVPTSVMSSTLKAAGLLAAGMAATGAISVKVAALTEGVLQSMLLTKLKIATAMFLVVALGLAGVSAGGLFYRTQAGEPSKGTEKKERLATKKDDKPMSDKERLPAEVERERKRLAGVWRLVGVEAGGKKATTEDMDQMVRMKLTRHFQNLGAKIPPNTDGAYLLVVYGRMGNWKEQSNHGTILAAGTSAINPTAEPKTVDWVIAGDTGDKGISKRGIYEIRTEDSWRVCFAPPGEDRPDRFTTSTKDGRVIWVFQRVKEDEPKRPAAKQGDVNQKNAKPTQKHTEKAVPAPIGTAEKDSPKNAKKEPNVLTPEEAIKQRMKAKLTVQFKVTEVIVQPLEGAKVEGYKEGPFIRLMYSKEFSVLLRGPASYRIMRLGIDPTKHFSGKRVRITGRVVPDNEKGPPFQICTDDLDQFEVVTE